jgi:hypothetical protein
VINEENNLRQLLNIRCESSLCQLPVAPLLPFNSSEDLGTAIPFLFEDYLELIDTLGRIVHPQKRGGYPG